MKLPDSMKDVLPEGAHEATAQKWRRGPLPPGTWNWGGVQSVADRTEYPRSQVFRFADFCGDHVKLTDGTTLRADEVAWFSNCLDLPPE